MNRREELPRTAETLGPEIRFSWRLGEAEQPERPAGRVPRGVALAIPTAYTPRAEAETMLRALEAAEAALAARVERGDAAAAELRAAGSYGEEWRRRVFRASSLSSALGELRDAIRRAKVEGLFTFEEAYGLPSAPGPWLFWNDGTLDRDPL
jgi:hypothetical protein